jgi:hypothetical protein
MSVVLQRVIGPAACLRQVLSHLLSTRKPQGVESKKLPAPSPAIVDFFHKNVAFGRLRVLQ